jgi:hypothetical protein
VPQGYLEIVSESVSRTSFDKNNPFDSHLLSIESRQLPSLDVVNYALENRRAFLRLINGLSAERRQIAVEYILLRKKEEQIAVMHGRRSQSMIGQELYGILQFIGAQIALGERPSSETIKDILLAENIVGASHISLVIHELLSSQACRFRPDIERLLSRLCQRLASDAITLKGKALAILISEALNRTGEVQRAQVHLRRARKVFSDPDFLGQFEIEINEEPDINALFTPRAGEVTNASMIERKRS